MDCSAKRSVGTRRQLVEYVQSEEEKRGRLRIILVTTPKGDRLFDSLPEGWWNESRKDIFDVHSGEFSAPVLLPSSRTHDLVILVSSLFAYALLAPRSVSFSFLKGFHRNYWEYSLRLPQGCNPNGARSPTDVFSYISLLLPNVVRHLCRPPRVSQHDLPPRPSCPTPPPPKNRTLKFQCTPAARRQTAFRGAWTSLFLSSILLPMVLIVNTRRPTGAGGSPTGKEDQMLKGG